MLPFVCSSGTILSPYGIRGAPRQTMDYPVFRASGTGRGLGPLPSPSPGEDSPFNGCFRVMQSTRVHISPGLVTAGSPGQ